jgi:3-dehydroquinate synthetase
MAVIPVAIAGAPYDVVIEEGALARAGALCRPFLRKDTVAVVTDENVAGAWRETVAASFAAQGIASHWLVLPAGKRPNRGKTSPAWSIGCCIWKWSARTTSSRWAAA